MKHPILAGLALAAAVLGAPAAIAQTQVQEAWVRGTVAQQKATGLFARITSAGGGRLVSAASPVAGVAEIHEMTLVDQVMRMRALPAGLELPAGKAVELKPGGHHIMLMDLKQRLEPGTTVPVTLVIEGRDGRKETIEVAAPVKALDGSAAAPHKH